MAKNKRKQEMRRAQKRAERSRRHRAHQEEGVEEADGAMSSVRRGMQQASGSGDNAFRYVIYAALGVAALMLLLAVLMP